MKLIKVLLGREAWKFKAMTRGKELKEIRRQKNFWKEKAVKAEAKLKELEERLEKKKRK